MKRDYCLLRRFFTKFELSPKMVNPTKHSNRPAYSERFHVQNLTKLIEVEGSIFKTHYSKKLFSGLNKDFLLEEKLKIAIIDTSSLINLRYYPREYSIFKPIWKSLEMQIKKSQLITLEEVNKEFLWGPDDLINWFKSFEEKIVVERNEKWFRIVPIMFSNLKQLGKKEPRFVVQKVGKERKKFNADPQLVALSMAIPGSFIVTEETIGAQKIPTIGEKYGKSCFKLLEYLQKLGALN